MKPGVTRRHHIKMTAAATAAYLTSARAQEKTLQPRKIAPGPFQAT